VISPNRYRHALESALRTLSETHASVHDILIAQRRVRASLRRANRRLRTLQTYARVLEERMVELRAATEFHQQRLRDELQNVGDVVTLHHEIAATNTAAFAPYQDAFVGRDLVVVASGPTLSHYQPIDGAIHIGVNSVIGNRDIPLDFYFAQDFGPGGGNPRVVSQFDEGKVPEGCKLFFGLLALTPNGLMEASQSLTARVGATRYFVDSSPSRHIPLDIRFHPLVDFYTVVFPALHFALFTNPRRIYLVGCDVSYFGHFDGVPQPETAEQIRTYLGHRLRGYRRMREFARTFYPETEIVSVNPVNLAYLFTDQVTAPGSYTVSEHQSALAGADFADEAIDEFVERHIAEVRG